MFFMRYAVLITALLVLLQKTGAQQPAADKWKTVNAFSMGDSKSKYTDQLLFWSKTGDGNNAYIYKTSGYKSQMNLVVFGWRYTSVYLIFNPKDELTGMQFITVYKPNDYNADKDYYTQQEKLIASLGPYTKKENSYKDGISSNGVSWQGNEVTISFIKNSGGKDGGLTNELIFLKKQ